jgi:trehalose 6-phosphate phosphatase
MRNILSAESNEVLRKIGHERPLLVFDFDGTLAPIVESPELAAMEPSTRTLLRLVCLMYPCAVVSGRARADVASRLAGIPLLAVVGNHGAEAGFGPVDRSPRKEVEAWRSALERDLCALAGVAIEDKGLSLAVHYRHAPARADARRAVLAAARRLPGARVFGGRAVVNVVPADSHDKGDAVARLLPRAGRPTAVYVGDDATDEDAFRNASVAVSVRVGRTHLSAAEWYVPCQTDLDGFLRELARARRRVEGLNDRLEGLERSVAERETRLGSRAG